MLKFWIPLLASILPLTAQFQTRLNPRTDQAFEEYRKAVETQFDGRPRFPSGLRPGQVEIIPARGRGPVQAQDGLIHDRRHGRPQHNRRKNARGPAELRRL